MSDQQGVPFVFPLVLLVCTFLQSQAPNLWSESRMLRKIRTLQTLHTDKELTLIVLGAPPKQGASPEHLFSTLYICLSKGRHRLVGRIFKFIFVLFMLSIDVLSFHPMMHDGQYIIDSEIVVTLRFLIYLGTLTVLGARPLSLCESLLTLAFSSLYGISLWTLGQTNRFHHLRVGANVTRYVFIGLVMMANEIPSLVRSIKSDSTHIADIANAVRSGTVNNNKRQKKRLQDMIAYAKNEVSDEARGTGEDCIGRRGDKNGRYWGVEWKSILWNIVTPLVLMLTNGISWGEMDKKILPTIVVVESLEAFSWILFWMNDYQVEPRLFVELVRLAEACH